MLSQQQRIQKNTTNRYFVVLILLLASSLLGACQVSIVNSGSYATPTPSWGVQTKDAEYLRPALFKAEDFNWEVGTYREMTAGLDIDVEFIEGKFYADDVMGATYDIKLEKRFPELNSKKGSILGAVQFIWIYSNQADAFQVGELERDRSEKTGMIGTQNIVPRLNIVVETCWGGFNQKVGNYQNCNFWGQHGRYTTTANMTVDGDILTMEDWINFINVIQDRLIAQVEMEASQEG